MFVLEQSPVTRIYILNVLSSDLHYIYLYDELLQINPNLHIQTLFTCLSTQTVQFNITSIHPDVVLTQRFHLLKFLGFGFFLKGCLLLIFSDIVQKYFKNETIKFIKMSIVLFSKYNLFFHMRNDFLLHGSHTEPDRGNVNYYHNPSHHSKHFSSIFQSFNYTTSTRKTLNHSQQERSVQTKVRKMRAYCKDNFPDFII